MIKVSDTQQTNQVLRYVIQTKVQVDTYGGYSLPKVQTCMCVFQVCNIDDLPIYILQPPTHRLYVYILHCTFSFFIVPIGVLFSLHLFNRRFSRVYKVVYVKHTSFCESHMPGFTLRCVEDRFQFVVLQSTLYGGDFSFAVQHAYEMNLILFIDSSALTMS